MPFKQGDIVGAYEIIEQLGQGGMATVYKAYHAALDRYVALKVMHPDLNEDPTFAARFQREARVVAKLEHPNIVPVHDFAEYNNYPYLVMKFIEGETLSARLKRGPLNSTEIEDTVNAVGAALTYAHRQGILHRDIKPSNVLIASDGQVYLADFGLARITQAGESSLSSDAILGTPQYISPEQAVGKTDVDEGTDIYSFGVMLYEMVVGRVPFNADTPFSIIYDHIYSPLPLPRAVNPAVPEAVENVLLKALAKQRADRYATVSDLTAAFKEAWESAGVPMQGTAVMLPKDAMKASGKAGAHLSSKSQKPKVRSNSLRLFITGAAAMIACCFFTIFLFGIASQFRAFLPTGTPTPTPTETASPEPTPFTFCSGEQTWMTRDYFPEREIQHCWDQDHYITDLVYADGEWTAVMGMDAGYTKQIHLADVDIPKDKIREYWDQGFDITEAAYAEEQWVVVMSRGTGFTNQSYLSDANFPDADIQDYWARDYSISAAEYGGGKWLVVMSKGANLGAQVYFSDADLPEEKIRNYWDAGYDITDITYGNALWVVVMSEGIDLSNQNYHTKNIFPEDGIKADWNEDYFITDLTFGNSLWVVVMSKP